MLITISEVAVLLDINQTTAYNYVKNKTIPESIDRKKTRTAWTRLWDRDAVLRCMPAVEASKNRSGVRGKDTKKREREFPTITTKAGLYNLAMSLFNKALSHGR